METNTLSKELKKAYLALEGKNYNAVHYQQNRYRYLKMIEFILPFSATNRILDIGAGFCYLTKFFKLQGYDIFALDFFYGDIPKIRCEKSAIPFYFLNVEVDEFPFEKEFFDVIILGEVIEHFTYSPITPLSEINKILKKDGVFVVTTPNAFRIIELLKMVSGYTLYRKLISSYREKPMWYKGKKFYYRHNKLYSIKKLRQLIVQAGFRVASSGYVNEGISLKENRIKIFLKIIFSPLLLIIPQFRDFLWIVAEKE